MNIVQEFNYELFGDEDIWAPTKATEDDACYDIRARAVISPEDESKTVMPLGEMIDSGVPGKVVKAPRVFMLQTGYRVLVLTGVFIELRPGWEALVRPRSGLAWKNAVTVRNSPGTIDARYRDEIGVILCNDNWIPPASREGFYFKINKGDRIAQLAIREVPPVKLNRVRKISRDADRGGGFGHTGK
jgi:dUTP pyrophosphatase